METFLAQIYIEAWRTNIPSCPWCAETSSVNPIMWQPKGGKYGYYDADRWNTWSRLVIGKTTVFFVSDHEFTHGEAIQVSEAVLSGKVRRFVIHLDDCELRWF